MCMFSLDPITFFMKRAFGYTGFILALATAQTQGDAATPAEQYQALLKQNDGVAYVYFHATNDTERQTIVERVDTATVRLLDLVEQNSKEPFALEALTHIVTQEYWLNTYTSHRGWGKERPQIG